MAADFPNYYHSMDREYFREGELPAMGISTPPMEDQLAALKVRIRQGVTRVELGFTGAGKGSMGGKQTTPEMYGKEEREAMRELAKINKVELSTHATVGVMGLAGLGEGGFSRQQAEQTLHEIERAIDFAADTAQGGAVVVHTGEWIRPVSSAGKGNEFEGYIDEANKATIYLADEKTGKMMAISKDALVWEPVPAEGKWHRDPVTGEKIIEQYEYERDKNGMPINVKVIPRTFKQIVDEEHNQPWAKGKTEEEIFVTYHFRNQVTEAQAQAKRWTVEAEQYSDRLEGIKKQEQKYLAISKEERLRRAKAAIDQQRAALAERLGRDISEIPEEAVEDPLIQTQKQKQVDEKQVEWMIDAAKTYAAQAEELKRKTGAGLSPEDFKKNPDVMKSIERVGLARSAETLSRAAMFAYQETKDKNLEKPLFVAPEAWQPEHWGSHPEEMKQLIDAGREKMADELVVTRGLSQEEAEKVAKQHIKATFDIGHAYTWRKFFKEEKGETMEQADKRFNKWLLDNVRDLAKKGIIGHIHLSDNFGYYDEHLTPGMGKAPIKEFMEEMKKAGVEVKAIVEPAHQDIRALHGAMGHLGSPVYGLGKWADIEQSYFGRTQPPYFATEAFMPVQREWQISYFGIPFE